MLVLWPSVSIPLWLEVKMKRCLHSEAGGHLFTTLLCYHGLLVDDECVLKVPISRASECTAYGIVGDGIMMAIHM